MRSYCISRFATLQGNPIRSYWLRLICDRIDRMKLSVGHRDVLRVPETNRPRTRWRTFARATTPHPNRLTGSGYVSVRSHGVPEFVVTNLPSLGQHEWLPRRRVLRRRQAIHHLARSCGAPVRHNSGVNARMAWYRCWECCRLRLGKRAAAFPVHLGVRMRADARSSPGIRASGH